jgi:hypothetical protein
MDEAFEPLALKQKKLSVDYATYRVYRDAENFEEVRAESAYEAMRESGVEMPYKITRYSLRDLSSLSSDMLADLETDLAESEPGQSAEDSTPDPS